MHLGRGKTIPARNIIAIIDIKNAGLADTQSFLQAQMEEDFVIGSGDDTPHSIVIAEEEGQARVYFSLARSSALLRRADYL